MTREQRKREVFLQICENLSRLSTCSRKHVGALIVKDGRCISWGYNGAPPGLPHCEDNNHGWGSIDPQDYTPEEYGCLNATHAEANALAFAARQGISTDGATLYVSTSPCDTCARLLIAAGIEEVVYDEEYRDQRGIDILREAGVACFYGTRTGRDPWPPPAV